MVSTPTRAWRLSQGPASLTAQLEAAFVLWLRSARPLLPFSLLYTLAGMLPMLTLNEVGARMTKLAGHFVAYAFNPALPEPDEDPAALLHALGDWASAPSTIALAAIAALLALYAVTGAILRQQRIAEGADTGLARAALDAFTRIPAAFASWLVYTLAMLVCTLPLAGLTALFFAYALQTGIGGLLLLLLVYLLGSLLLTVPLAWASVALGYAPVLATIDGSGPIASHRTSARLVRGHWKRAATLMTVPLLVYFGLGSTVSSTVYGVLGLAVLTGGGLTALLDGGWLTWAGWLVALPMAFCLPLTFSGLLTSLHDLRGRNGPRA